MEAQAGNDVKFINPDPGFVVKTSIYGSDLKVGRTCRVLRRRICACKVSAHLTNLHFVALWQVFINICQSDSVSKPVKSETQKSGKRGVSWSIPHTTTTHREDKDKAGVGCIVYDVVFHPQALRLSTEDVRIHQMLVNTAFDGIERRFPVRIPLFQISA